MKATKAIRSNASASASGRAIRVLILAGALVMTAIGLYNSEAGTVLTKAANICLECIGIG
jgi:hypothetical protein